MSKLTNSLVPSVQQLINVIGVKVMTDVEINENPKLKKVFAPMPANYQAVYHPLEDLIVIKEAFLQNSTEIILHELIHWSGAKDRLDRKWITDAKAVMENPNDELIDSLNERRDTEEATAQIGMLKLVMVLGLNPAQFTDLTLAYLENLLDFNLAKADKDSDKAVEYLVSFLGMRKAA